MANINRNIEFLSDNKLNAKKAGLFKWGRFGEEAKNGGVFVFGN
jgi:hypothetical protein